MSNRSWNKEGIATSLYQLHSKGISLRTEEIQRADSGITNAIFYKDKEGNFVHFGSVKTAREAAAVYAEQVGDNTAAEAIRAYNKKQQSPRRFTKEQAEKRKEELVKELKRRIAAEEDVSYRYLQEHDRAFVGKCVYAFGSYKGCFKEAGIEYKNYARHIKKGKSAHLEELIELVVSGADLERGAIKERDAALLSRLDAHFNGYYDALEKAREELEKRELTEFIERADPVYWERKTRREEEKRKAKEREIALEGIVTIDRDMIYAPGDFPKIEYAEERTGRELWDIIKRSEAWLTTRMLAEALECTEGNVVKNLTYRYANRAIRYKEGETTEYAFERTVLRDYKRKNKTKSRNNSIQTVARRLGVSYSKIRSILQNIGVEVEGEEYKELLPEQVAVLETIVEREEKLRIKIKRAINPDEAYTFNELDIRGVPSSHFYRRVRAGTIQVTTKGGARALYGRDILPYFYDELAPIRLSQALRLLTYFHPHLFTPTDLVQQLEMNRSTLLYRLHILLEENQNACFRIRKSEMRSKIVVTEEIPPFLRHWSERHGLEFLNVMLDYRSEKRDSLERITKEAARLAESMNGITKDNTTEAFEAVRKLRRCLTERVDIGKREIQKKDLRLIAQYMRTHKYPILELEREYYLAEIEEIIGNPDVIEKAMKLTADIGFSIYYANLGLVRTIVNRISFQRGIDSEDIMQAGEDALLRAVKGYDVKIGTKFSSYAGRAIEWGIQSALRNKWREVSLFKEIGEDAELIDFIEAPKQEQESLPKDALHIINEVIEQLPEREAEVIKKRFGLGGYEKETLEHIGEKRVLTRQRIQQIEKKIMEKLAEDPRLKELEELLE